MNEKAFVNRAKLIEKAFELSLSKVLRHSCHTQPFFGAGDFYSESVIQAVDRSSRTRAAQAYDRRRRRRAGASVAGSSLFSVEHRGRLNSARTTSLFLIIVVHLFGGDVHTD